MYESEPIRKDWSAAADGVLARAIARQPAGVPGAEAELCARFAKRVRLYGMRHLKNQDAALDLAQDVMILTIQKLRAGEVREPDRIGSFILGSARMMVHEQHRGRSREDLFGDDFPVGLEFTQNEPDSFAADRLKKCLDSLAERERAILMLTYYAEQSTATIAGSLGIEAGNVRVIRHRGMENLRDCIGVGKEAKR